VWMCDRFSRETRGSGTKKAVGHNTGTWTYLLGGAVALDGRWQLVVVTHEDQLLTALGDGHEGGGL
jgi:hypothetical protein